MLANIPFHRLVPGTGIAVITLISKMIVLHMRPNGVALSNARSILRGVLVVAVLSPIG